MAARPRIRIRAHWPANLLEPRPGYYVWRDPINKKLHAIGRVPLAQAIYDAQQANFAIEKIQPRQTLVDKITAPVAIETIADLIKRMPTNGVKQSTLDSRKYRDRFIEMKLGTIACSDLTTKHVADMLEAIEAEKKMQWAVQIRSRMKQICRRGKALGWMKENPVTDTERAKVTVKRRRMSLEVFQATFEKAPEVAPWLQNAMLLALVSGQDKSTIARWQRSFNRDGVARLHRGKTGADLEIPLEIRLEAIGMSLAEVISRCNSTGVISKYLIHHTVFNSSAPKGSPIKLQTISTKFRDARVLAGYDHEHDPTFHEIRSLSKRLYDKEGNVDTKALLAHKSDSAANTYADSRGLEPIRVRIKNNAA